MPAGLLVAAAASPFAAAPNPTGIRPRALLMRPFSCFHNSTSTSSPSAHAEQHALRVHHLVRPSRRSPRVRRRVTLASASFSVDGRLTVGAVAPAAAAFIRRRVRTRGWAPTIAPLDVDGENGSRAKTATRAAGSSAAGSTTTTTTTTSTSHHAEPSVEAARKQLWHNVSTAVNVVIVTGIVWFSLSSFLTASPQFTKHVNDLFNSRVWSRVHAAFVDLPVHNWAALEFQLLHHPWRTAAIMTGVSYGLADWTAQTCEGCGPFGFSRLRLLRSCVVGAILLAPLAHSYYEFQDWLIPETLGKIGAPIKLALDQSIYAATYNCVFFMGIGLLRRDHPRRIFADIKDKFWQMMRAGWKLWPFVHIVTYTMIPTRFKLLWVDTIEVIWVTYLSMVANARRKQTRDAVQEVVGTSRSRGSGSEGGQGRSAEDTAGFLEQRRATVALRALAERVESLRALAAEGEILRKDARERHADGLSLECAGTGLAGADRYHYEREDTCLHTYEYGHDAVTRPNVTVSNDSERGLTEVQIAGAERPGLMLDIMLSMRAQGIGVVQGVIDATDGRLSANVFYVMDELHGNAALSGERRRVLERSLRAQLMAAAMAEKTGAQRRRVVEIPGGGFEFAPGAMDRVKSAVDSINTRLIDGIDHVTRKEDAISPAAAVPNDAGAHFVTLAGEEEEDEVVEKEASEELGIVKAIQEDTDALASLEQRGAPPHAATELLAAIDNDKQTRALVGQTFKAEGLAVPDSFVADMDDAAKITASAKSENGSGGENRGDAELVSFIPDGVLDVPVDDEVTATEQSEDVFPAGVPSPTDADSAESVPSSSNFSSSVVALITDPSAPELQNPIAASNLADSIENLIVATNTIADEATTVVAERTKGEEESRREHARIFGVEIGELTDIIETEIIEASRDSSKEPGTEEDGTRKTR